MRYAGFAKRFLALIIDLLLFTPLLVLRLEVPVSRSLDVVFGLVLGGMFCLYHVYMHARFGQTVGKMFARIQLRQTGGGAVTLDNAVRRNLVDIAFVFLFAAVAWQANFSVSESEFARLGRDHFKLTSQRPVGRWAGRADQAWVWSELVVILFNRRRRALHDYIAGTVVVEAP
jgi:uncharacterized RDD family membrane protein YckC